MIFAPHVFLITLRSSLWEGELKIAINNLSFSSILKGVEVKNHIKFIQIKYCMHPNEELKFQCTYLQNGYLGSIKVVEKSPGRMNAVIFRVFSQEKSGPLLSPGKFIA